MDYAERKAGGVYYTPPALVAPLVARTLAPLLSTKPLRICEPACGDGAFLLEARRYVPAEWLYGVDRDPIAVERAREALPGAHLAVADSLVDFPFEGEFDAVLGNPPWEILKPNSLEFFERHDPLYRTYGKGEALIKQRELFARVDGLQAQWSEYEARFKAFSRHVKATYRLQDSGDLNAYKLFLELGLNLLRDGGRLGMLVPSAIYTDKGTTTLRRTLLEECEWEWCYGFENRAKVFAIDSRFKFAPIVVQRGGTTKAVKAAFMRHDVREWERPPGHVELSLKDIRRFAPRTWSFMEFRDRADAALAERLYDGHPLLGDVVAEQGARYASELHMTNAAKHFVPASDEPGLVPLYEGKSFWLHNPYYRAPTRSVPVDVLPNDAWRSPRLVFRDVASSTNQRTLVTAVIPPAAHGNKAPSLDGLDDPYPLAGLLGSLTLDYLLRMKVSATVNWFYAETLPIPPIPDEIAGLVRRLNAVHDVADPLLAAPDRLAARLVIDALVAQAFALTPEDVAHIATRFPIYDRAVPPAQRYPRLAVHVFSALHAHGLEAARRRAADLAARRDCGLDALSLPPRNVRAVP